MKQSVVGIGLLFGTLSWAQVKGCLERPPFCGSPGLSPAPTPQSSTPAVTTSTREIQQPNVPAPSYDALAGKVSSLIEQMIRGQTPLRMSGGGSNALSLFPILPERTPVSAEGNARVSVESSDPRVTHFTKLSSF